MKRRFFQVAAVIMLVASIACAGNAEGRKITTMEFKNMLRTRILEVLDSWPAEDQYAIMFFVYPNEAYEYRGYSNIAEFLMLYRCESDIKTNHNPLFRAMSDDEERWNPAFWDPDLQATVIGFDDPNPIADALVDWYEALGVQDNGYEDPNTMYDSNGIYIGKGPNGLPELLQVVVEIAAELQNDGTIEAKFGRKIPIVLANFEFTWYMIRATRNANPNGEADEYIQSCLRQGFITDAQLE